MAEAAADGRRRHRHGRHQGRRSGRRRRHVHLDRRASGSSPPDRELVGRIGVAAGDVVLVSGTIADHGMAVMLARGDLALDADIVSDTAPLHEPGGVPARRRHRRPGGCVTPRGAASERSATSWPVTPISPSCSRRRRFPCGPPWPPPASCWASTRSTWPTRASSSPSSPPTRPTRRWRRCRAHPLGRDAVQIGEIREEPPGIVVLVTPIGGTRIVDMLVGDPLAPHLLTSMALTPERGRAWLAVRREDVAPRTQGGAP